MLMKSVFPLLVRPTANRRAQLRRVNSPQQPVTELLRDSKMRATFLSGASAPNRSEWFRRARVFPGLRKFGGLVVGIGRNLIAGKIVHASIIVVTKASRHQAS